MATIPEIRLEMLLEAKNCPDLFLRQKLLTWERELHRRPPARKANRHCRPMTEATAEAIREYAAAHPRAGYQVMSARFGVSIGRVSETLAGKRT